MWIIYTDDTHPNSQYHGAIELIFDGKEAAALECVTTHQAHVAGEADPQAEYVDLATLQPVAKTVLGASLSASSVAADGVSEVTLSGLPVPFTVMINGDDVIVDDGSLEFSTDTPGEYTIMCQSAQYLTESFTVYAV